MTLYNVAAMVVEVIEANTPEAAQRELDRRLRAARFEVLPEHPEPLVSETDPAYNSTED